MAPKYSIITTCKGRLHDLKRSLPGFLNQPDAEVIVVDYDCPDGTAAYVQTTHPEARVVCVADRPLFNASHARNLGAAQAGGEFLVFLDADVIIAGNFLESVDRIMNRSAFALFGSSAKNSLRGSCIIWRTHFETIGGYDELMTGYASEDLDIYMRLQFIGVNQLLLDPATVIEVIAQTPAEKERFRGPDLKKQFLRGQLYLSAKDMVMRTEGTPVLPLALRRDIYAEIDRKLPALYAGDEDFVLQITLPDKYQRGFLNEWEFARAVVVRARRRKSAHPS